MITCFRCGKDFGDDVYCQHCQSCGHCGCCPCGKAECDGCEGYVATLADMFHAEDGYSLEDARQLAEDTKAGTVRKALERAQLPR